ncbi:MAG: hypothetical protein JWN01_395 [Patescibacteria group bacterium]|nr:hypothetical protein [Patescibacteria group bacterium]
MTRRLYILDFDRTVFDTDCFIADTKILFRHALGISARDFDATQNLYIEPNTKYYNFHGHIESLAGIGQHDLDQLITSQLRDRDYLYPDSAAWLATRDPLTDTVIIMTVGRPPFQQLKFNYAKAIDGLRKIIVPKNKGELIREHILDQPEIGDLNLTLNLYDRVYLVDDSPETFTGLGKINGVKGLRIVRPDGKYRHIPTPPSAQQITNFGDLP